jgi:hypothetical protein
MMAVRPKLWRVRVLRQEEAWVDVEAHDRAEAYVEAAKRPRVVNVFPRSAVLVETKLFDQSVVEE